MRHNIERFSFELDMNCPEDQLIFDKLERLSRQKRNSKITEILYNYFREPNSLPKTQQQMLNIIENMSKTHTPSYIPQEVAISSKIATSTPIQEIKPVIEPIKVQPNEEPKETSMKLGELKPIEDFDLNLPDPKEESEDEKSLTYLKNVFYKNTTEFTDEVF